VKGIWASVSGAMAQSQKLDTIANNLANVDTPGFKKDGLTFKEHLSVLEKPENQVIDIPRKEFELKDFYHHYGNDKSLVSVDGGYTDHSQGSLQQTSSPLDVAIEGKGFFEVLTPRGVRFTRQGNFKISPEGKLVTPEGFSILSKTDPGSFDSSLLTTPPKPGEEPQKPEELIASVPPEAREIFINSEGKLSISPSGNVTQAGRDLGELSVVEFKEQSLLKKEGEGLYINPDESNVSSENEAYRLHQGFLESSNVNPILEMTEMIKTNRLFESMSKAIKAYDGIEGQAVNLGKVYE